MRGLILVPILLLGLVTPSLVERATHSYADLPLGYLVAIAALLMFMWLHDNEPWQLTVATVLLAGSMLTKREGPLFAVCVVAAALAVSHPGAARSGPAFS